MAVQRFPVTRLGPPKFNSPLGRGSESSKHPYPFVKDEFWIRYDSETDAEGNRSEDWLFESSGPRQQLFFDPFRTRAAIVTCGGLSPGLNNVIRSLFLELHFNYGVPEVLGIRQGYLGLTSAGERPLTLTCDLIDQIHKEGGTILASSRGRQDVAAMVDFLAHRQVDMLFCIGGDGTQHGAYAIHQEAVSRGLNLSVVGIPKTIDNDLLYCDRTFGFATAIEEASKVLHSAHVEAKGTPRGIGLVKLMGRDAGFIACGATLASQEVNFTLIPEQPFRLTGPNGLLAALRRRMHDRCHAVIAVAEGAGQHLFSAGKEGSDASGNRRYHDIGIFLKQEIASYFAEIGEPVEIKYIDPSYTIRSVPANAADGLLCDQFARRAVHAALAGRTNLLIGYHHGQFIHVPLEMANVGKRQVGLHESLWLSVLATTGQPANLDE